MQTRYGLTEGQNLVRCRRSRTKVNLVPCNALLTTKTISGSRLWMYDAHNDDSYLKKMMYRKSRVMLGTGGSGALKADNGSNDHIGEEDIIRDKDGETKWLRFGEGKGVVVMSVDTAVCGAVLIEYYFKTYTSVGLL